MIGKLKKQLLGMQRVNADGQKSPNTERLNKEYAENRGLDEQNLMVMQSNNERIEQLVIDKMKAFGLKLNGINKEDVDIEDGKEAGSLRDIQCDAMSVASSQCGKQEADI